MPHQAVLTIIPDKTEDIKTINKVEISRSWAEIVAPLDSSSIHVLESEPIHTFVRQKSFVAGISCPLYDPSRIRNMYSLGSEIVHL